MQTFSAIRHSHEEKAESARKLLMPRYALSPGLLCQVFGDFSIFHTPFDMRIEAGVVFGNEGTEGIGVSLLCSRDAAFFGTIKHAGLLLSGGKRMARPAGDTRPRQTQRG